MKLKVRFSLSAWLVGMTVLLAIICSILVYFSANESELIIQDNNYSFLELFVTNLKVLGLIYLGVISFGGLSALLIFFNVLNLSLYFWATVQYDSFFVAVKHIIFHGPFELGAFLLAYYVVLDQVINSLKYGALRLPTRLMYRYLKLILLSVFLLLLAAVIEFIELKYFLR